jgi:hypothetical protein
MACTETPDKIGYSTLRGAVTAMVEVHDEHGVWQRPYRCDDCHEYHLTSKDLTGLPVTEDQAAQMLAVYSLI